ncbi:MAG: uroporphyrinogen-III C-methyltransferase [Deltaproteobacteria bacterium]|nr:uroporphyrinogen-III C-methyltransferase [Deltaproteobacteria bacterium]
MKRAAGPVRDLHPPRGGELSLEAAAARLHEWIIRQSRGDSGAAALGERLLRGLVEVARSAPVPGDAASHLVELEAALRRTERSRRGGGVGRRGSGPGSVSLVGAGPGAPDLLTLRAVERLQQAEVVLHDALVSAAVLRLCAPGTRLVDVGKRRGQCPVGQEAIEAQLVAEARRGRRVVRLKGGDPFVFGRGGEEALALARHGIACEVVPGVSSGLAVPSLAGIPLTHRGLSSSAVFVTAHELESARPRARLAGLAAHAETLVVFMAGAELEGLRRALLAAGLAADTPAAVLESGSLPSARAHLGTVDELVRLGDGRRGGPTLVVVGPTVALASQLGETTQRRAEDQVPREERRA